MSTAPAVSLDPRVGEARRWVRAGRIGAALGLLTGVGAELDEATGGATGRVDRALCAALTVECLLARGAAHEALELSPLLTTLGAGAAKGADLAAAVALHAEAEIAETLGEAETAVRGFLAAGTAGGPDQTLVPWRAGAALGLVRLGRRREALTLAREHLGVVAAAGPYDVARALRTLATVDPDHGGTPRLRDALTVLLDEPAERLRAQISVDLAALLLLRGDAAEVAEAVVLLRATEPYAADEALVPLEQRVRRLLSRAGERPRRHHDEILAALTAGERRVTLLALAGHSNREIAGRLEVSVKAVEGHLSKVYRKLGVSSRRTLQATLRRPA